MSISGNLETMELSELLQWVAQSAKTGTLVIDRGVAENRVFFDVGSIVATASSNPDSRLGNFFVRRGLITDDQLTEALEMQEGADMLLGKVLVTMGAVSEANAQALLIEKAEECIFDMFSWPAGEFRFVEEQPLTGSMVPISIDVTGIVLKAAEREDEQRRIDRIIPSVHCVPVGVGFLEDAAPEPRAQKILNLVDDDRTVEEISELSATSEFFVNQVLYSMLEKGRLKIVKPRREALGEAPSDGDGEITATTHLNIADHKIATGEFAGALRHLGAARSLDPGKTTARKIDEAETRIRTVLEEEGILLKAIPQLNLSPSEIPKLDLSPEEGFVMSRIDGSYDIESILKISPMPVLDARIVVRKLVLDGHINLERPED